MANTLDLGRVRLVHKGAYGAGTAYEFFDCATYNGSSYVCTADAGSPAGTLQMCIRDRAYRKALREAEKDHTSAYNQMENNAASYTSEVEQTEASILSLIHI